MVAEGVGFARPGAGFTRDFEQMVAWLVIKTDKKTICEFMRIGWRTVGAIAQRVAKDELDPQRLSGLVDIGRWCLIMRVGRLCGKKPGRIPGR